MKSILFLFIIGITLAACAPLAPQPIASGGGVGKPCVGVASNGCFPGGKYPATHLAEGGNPDRGGGESDGSNK